MTNTDRLTFTLTVAGQDARTVYPRYGADISIEQAHEDDERFLRRTLSGKLTFIREDFAYIMAQPFDTMYNVTVAATSGAVLYRGHFVRTDGTMNVDDGTITVSLTSDDYYNDILAGMTTEIDIAQLPIPVVNIDAPKYATYQVYISGDEQVLNYQRGQWFTRECDAVSNNNDLTSKYYFTLTSVAAVLTITKGPDDLKGTYAGNTILQADGSSSTWLTKTNGAATDKHIQMIQNNGMWDVSIYADAAGKTKLYEPLVFSRAGLLPTGINLYKTDTVQDPDAPDIRITVERDFVYTRLLTDAPSVEQVDAKELRADDIAPLTYARALSWVSQPQYVYQSVRTTSDATPWGMAPNGGYYLPPVDGPQFIPLSPYYWGTFSLWLLPPTLGDMGVVNVRLRDGYMLSDVISAMLKVVAPNVTHEGTPEYSRFLYDTMRPVADVSLQLAIFQKSNILNLWHTQAAQRAPLTLEGVFTMLKNVLKCYWYVDDAGRLHIEHVSYLDNGYSYDAPTVGVDLTTLYNTRNGKPWAFGQNKYSYSKVSLPERYEFEWGDEVSDIFTGGSIEVLSPNVSRGDVQKIAPGNYNPDISRMLIAPDDMDMDGFALVGVQFINNTTETLPYKEECTELMSSGAAYGALISEPIVPTRGGVYIRITGRVTGYAVAPYALLPSVCFAALVKNFAEGEAVDETAYFTPPIPLPESGVAVPFTVNMPATPFNWGFALATTAVNELSRDYRFRVELEIDSIQTIQITETNVNDTPVLNGYLSYAWLIPNVWLYDMPARALRVNGTDMQAVTLSHAKTQDVTFPVTGTAVDTTKLIKTGVGEGRIDKYALSLLSQHAKITLSYETDK